MAKGQISKRVLQEDKARQIFRKKTKQKKKQFLNADTYM